MTPIASGLRCSSGRSSTCPSMLRRSCSSTLMSARFTCPQEAPKPRAEYRSTACPSASGSAR